MAPIPRLPSAINEVRVPHFFAPSRFAELERCPLSVLGELQAEELLPPAATAILGTIVHHVRHQFMSGRWSGSTSAEAAAGSLLAIAVREAEAQLGASPATFGLLPLIDAVGARKWDELEHRLGQWISMRSIIGGGVPPSPLPNLLSRRTEGGSDERILEFGEEARVVAPELRIRGRMDQLERLDPGSVEITDFKTGRIRDPQGEVLRDATIQLKLYALAVEAIEPVGVSLVLAGGERVAIPWNGRSREDARTRLESMSNQLPPLGSLTAASIAKPGVHCRSCRLRPCCAAYLESAPELWIDRERAVAMPLDTWGVVERIETERTGDRVELRDPTGRLVIIDGLDPMRRIADQASGTSVFFFGLVSSEDPNPDRPCNFHEHPADGGRRLPRARVLRVFCARAGSTGALRPDSKSPEISARSSSIDIARGSLHL